MEEDPRPLESSLPASLEEKREELEWIVLSVDWCQVRDILESAEAVW